MDSGQREGDKAPCKANGGLDSLVAAASRGTEDDKPEEEVNRKEDNSEKREEPSKGQKGKVRKAYTITKQRERWTEGEHERFLQALKRYGRAWRKIEEHIGTKTAVQIRSHAQKFFSKLQREQSGVTAEESSKAGISIPPPRPKRRPSHPYPRKQSTLDTEHSGEMETEKGNAAPTQPSTSPSHVTPATASAGGNASLSMQQILESAAAAAAFAWSQVVASAGPRVQQQLQAHVAAQGQAPRGIQQQASNETGVPGLHSQQMQTLRNAVVKNLQSGSQHFSNQPLQHSPGCGVYSSASPTNLQSTQESPNGGENTTAASNDRDSASSREDKKRTNSINPARPIAVSPFQQWPGSLSRPNEARPGRAARDWLASSHRHPGSVMPASQLPSAAPPAKRTVSAGAVLDPAQPGRQVGDQMMAEGTHFRGFSGAIQPSKGNSGLSQMAHFYQQAAADDQTGRENAENGSSAGEDGGSGSGGSSTDGGKRSDKGSNNDNTCASDEDGHAHASDGTTTAADLLAQEGKGSDDGSNSPMDMQNSPAGNFAGKSNQDVSGLLPSMLFGMNATVDTSCLGSASSPWQQPAGQLPPPGLHSHRQQTVPQVLSPQQQLAAYQRQALQAWAATAQQGLPTYQLMQSMLTSLQAQGLAMNPNLGLNPTASTPLVPALAGSLQAPLEPHSSEASMDTFKAPVQPGSLKRSSLILTAHQSRDDAGGFKPYSKKHGMPISSLPPSKRFAAATSIDRPVAVKPQANPIMFAQPAYYTAQ